MVIPKLKPYFMTQILIFFARGKDLEENSDKDKSIENVIVDFFAQILSYKNKQSIKNFDGGSKVFLPTVFMVLSLKILEFYFRYTII